MEEEMKRAEELIKARKEEAEKEPMSVRRSENFYCAKFISSNVLIADDMPQFSSKIYVKIYPASFVFDISKI